MEANPLQIELIAAVREHARKNYEAGWDIVVEAWEDADILKAIGVSKTAMGAIREVNKLVRLHSDIRGDIQAEAF